MPACARSMSLGLGSLGSDSLVFFCCFEGVRVGGGEREGGPCRGGQQTTTLPLLRRRRRRRRQCPPPKTATTAAKNTKNSHPRRVLAAHRAALEALLELSQLPKHRLLRRRDRALAALGALLQRAEVAVRVAALGAAQECLLLRRDEMPPLQVLHRRLYRLFLSVCDCVCAFGRRGGGENAAAARVRPLKQHHSRQSDSQAAITTDAAGHTLALAHNSVTHLLQLGDIWGCRHR